MNEKDYLDANNNQIKEGFYRDNYSNTFFLKKTLRGYLGECLESHLQGELAKYEEDFPFINCSEEVFMNSLFHALFSADCPRVKNYKFPQDTRELTPIDPSKLIEKLQKRARSLDLQMNWIQERNNLLYNASLPQKMYKSEGKPKGD